jgi:hypothetical protein
MTVYAIAAAAAAPAWSAPQALALVATDKPVQLACGGAGCSAEFTAFCLQPERISPPPGTDYRLSGKSRITASATTRDGRKLALAPRTDLRFQAMRGHTAIQISLAPDVRRRLNVQSVSLSLAAHVVLAPQAVADDDNPISDDDLALVEDSLRPVGAMVVDDNQEGMAAARLANRLINLLPGYENDVASTAKHWRGLMLGARQDGLRPMAVRFAQNAYDLCRYYADRVVPGDMRRCMQGQHDRLIKRLNSKYWKAIRTGS